MSEAPASRGRQLALRLGFLVLLAGGLLFWARARAPRQLELVVDLTDALPGELAEIDVVVTRQGTALFRSDRRYGKAGAPQRERFELRAAPGPAQVEVTLVHAGRPAQRVHARVELHEDNAAVVLTH